MHAPRLIDIHDLDRPELAPFRDQKDAWLRARHHPDAPPDATGTGMSGGLFIAEGELVFEQLVASRHEVVSVLVARPRLPRLEPLLARLPPDVPVFVAEPELVEALVGFQVHRGVLGCGRSHPLPTLDELLSRAQHLVVLEDLANHDNIGGIFRSVRALIGDSGAILMTSACCDPLYRRALRVSIGHALHVPYTWLPDWPGDLHRIAAAGFATLALTPAPDAIDLSDIPRTDRTCLIVGAEGPGLTPQAMAAAQRRVRIPIHPAVDSLNVTVALSIALSDVARKESRPDGVWGS